MVIPVDRDSPRLNGANAALFRKAFSICVRKDKNEGERAFLVGHEVGHIELHPDGMASHSTCASGQDVSSTRTSGTQYVEAYGARERAELQANVFSRELLLPRTLATELRVAGWSTSRMSAELKLPIELVRQQLLDGLLLTAPGPSAPERPAPPLTTEQEEAAFATERFINVVAGPGSGKTRTLIARISHLIESGCPAHRIAVLTFSNKAAREIVERLDAAGVRDVQNVWAGTFHAFGLEFIRKFHDFFGLPADVQVLDRLAQLELASTGLESLGLEHYSPYDDPANWLDPVFAKVINRCREDLVDAHAYKTAVDALGASSTPAQRDVVRIFLAYQAALVREKTLDFTALVEWPAVALKSSPAAFAAMTQAYDHVLVDEYQDVNRATAQMLVGFTQHASVWVVGDPRQAIYRFRGASLRNLTNFATDFEGAQRKGLRKNWRTGPTFVEFVNHIGARGPLAAREGFQQLRGDEGKVSYPPALAPCETQASMIATLGNQIRDAVAQAPNSHSSHMVLARSHDTLTAAASHLQRLGIPSLYFGGFFERPAIRDALSLFQLLVERFPSALTRVAKLAPVQMADADVRLIQEAVAADPELGRLAWLADPPAGLSSAGANALARLRLVLGSLSWRSSPWEAVCHFLLDQPDALLRARTCLVAQDQVDDLAQWMFAYFCRSHDGHRRRLTLGRLLHRVRRRQRLKDVGPLRELPPEAENIDAVCLMTIHGSKGLESPHVHLLDANNGSFESFDTALDSRLPADILGIDAAEERYELDVEADNLLFVAVSRTEAWLTLYEDHSAIKWRRIASLESWQGGLTLVTPAVEAAAVTAAPAAHVISTTLEQVLSFVSCPRRFFYREVLGLQGSGDASLGARALGAVLDALRELVKGGAWAPEDRERVLYRLWLDKGLPEFQENEALWWYAVAKMNAAIELLGGRLVPLLPRTIQMNGHQVVVQLDALTTTGEPSEGGLFMLYDAIRPKKDRELLYDVAASLATPARRKPLIELVNIRSSGVRQAKAWENGALAVALDQMARGHYGARPESGHCAGCPYLFICDAA
jgi:superfamily I DNA/RNA helicase